MIPIKIHMVDFLSYVDETFDFTQIKDATVIGKNGSGKSSFCTDAITWALFGEGSKGGVQERANYVRQGANICVVELTFEMNNCQYKVVRNYNLSNKKTSLVVFGVAESGDEVPLCDKAREAQEIINNMLKMNYATFTASSIVPQNQIHAFTEGMKDSEKKDALLSVLNVGVWNYYQTRNNEELKRLKSELDVCDGKMQLSQEVIEKEEEFTAALATAESNLVACKANKKAQEERVNALNDKMNVVKSIETEVGNIQSLLASKQDFVRVLQNQIDTASREIDNAKTQQQGIAASVEKVNKIIEHGQEIRDAVVREESLTKSLEQMTEAKRLHDASVQALDNLKKMGVSWNSAQQQKISTLTARKQEKTQQAALVQSVPCSTTDFAPKCPLLSMAFEAKKELVSIEADLIAAQQESNPYRDQWATEEAKRRSYAAMFTDENIETTKQSLEDTKRYSRLLPQLESAEEQLANYRALSMSADSIIKEKTDSITSTTSEMEEIKKEVLNLSENLKRKENELLSFNEVRVSFKEASDALSAAEKAEMDAQADIAKAKADLARVADEKNRIKDISEQVEKIQKRKEVLDIFADACNKRNGVPAFMVANAIPELEANANELLEKMMDGRLQIRFRTSKDSDDDGVGKLFRIDVYEQSEAEPREFMTFSGAEKFIIALAIRISMSKFLAHRAGSSVQLFVLDEGVSCADTENREEIMKAIRNITGDFAKVLFITHDEELKDTLSSKIIVRKDSRGSHIEVEAA